MKDGIYHGERTGRVDVFRTRRPCKRWLRYHFVSCWRSNVVRFSQTAYASILSRRTSFCVFASFFLHVTEIDEALERGTSWLVPIPVVSAFFQTAVYRTD
jgi:hypothetical protein